MPLRLGPSELQAGVPSLIRLATSPWAGPLLGGYALPTRAGRLHLQWLASIRTLLLQKLALAEDMGTYRVACHLGRAGAAGRHPRAQGQASGAAIA